MRFTDYGKINNALIQRYLLSHGWSREYSFPNKNLIVYSFSDDSRVAIPSSEKFKDYIFSIDEMIGFLADFEERSENEILHDIISFCQDRIEFRIISSETRDGSLPLSFASDCVEGIRDLVLYSADAEMNIEPICTRPTKLAYKTLGDFRFAQTSVGSFVFNVDAVIVNAEFEQIALDGEVHVVPETRKVVTRICEALCQVADISVSDISLESVVETAYLTGITANMCEALLKLKPKDSEVTVTTRFEFAAAMPMKKHCSRELTLTSNQFRTISELEKYYYSKKTMIRATLRGIVKSLTINKDTDSTEKVIRLATEFQKSYHTIMIDLSDWDYSVACDAHRDEVEVEVEGDLDMSTKMWRMINVQYFKRI